MAIDLGKQVGPLPMGAWVAVVGAGLGIALYTRRQNAVPNATLAPEDASMTPGVGTGPGWIAVPPPTNAPTADTYTDNDSWGRAAINWLLAQGYPEATSYSAITKALAGGTGDNKMSSQEYSLWAVALRHMGAPPYPVLVPPPVSVPIVRPPVTTPPTGGPHFVKRSVMGVSMYQYMRMSHPTATAAQANQRAAVAIDYNRAHGINPWGNTPRAQATVKRIAAKVWVY